MAQSTLVKRWSPRTPFDQDQVFIDFTDNLSTGETLTGTPTVTASPSGLTLGAATVIGTTVAGVQVQPSGTAGFEYVVQFTVQTSGGRTVARSGILPVVTALT